MDIMVFETDSTQVNGLRDAHSLPLRQEASPNSTCSFTQQSVSGAVPKPPTPTASPKQSRRRTTSNSSTELVRACVDLDEEELFEAPIEEAGGGGMAAPDVLTPGVAPVSSSALTVPEDARPNSASVRRTKSFQGIIQKLNSNQKERLRAEHKTQESPPSTTTATATAVPSPALSGHKRTGSDGSSELVLGRPRSESPRKMYSDSSNENLADSGSGSNVGPRKYFGPTRIPAPPEKLPNAEFLKSFRQQGRRDKVAKSSGPVLPDRKLNLNSMEKTSSTENLQSVAADVGIPTVPQSVHKKPAPPSPVLVGAAAGPSSFDPQESPTRFITTKRPSDSDEGSDELAGRLGSGLPPRSRPAHINKKRPVGIPVSQPMAIAVARMQHDKSPSIEPESDPESQVSDSDPEGSPSNDRDRSKGSQSGSLELLHQIDNPTVPVIKRPSARLVKDRPLGSSPPKKVTWDETPEMLKYLVEKAENPSSYQHRRHHHRRNREQRNHADRSGSSKTSDIPFDSYRSDNPRRAHSDERLDDERINDIASKTLISVHESYMTQRTYLIKAQMKILEEVKRGEKSMASYRDKLAKCLNEEEKIVKKMQTLLDPSPLPAHHQGADAATAAAAASSRRSSSIDSQFSPTSTSAASRASLSARPTPGGSAPPAPGAPGAPRSTGVRPAHSVVNDPKPVPAKDKLENAKN